VTQGAGEVEPWVVTMASTTVNGSGVESAGVLQLLVPPRTPPRDERAAASAALLVLRCSLLELSLSQPVAHSLGLSCRCLWLELFPGSTCRDPDSDKDWRTQLVQQPRPSASSVTHTPHPQHQLSGLQSQPRLLPPPPPTPRCSLRLVPLLLLVCFSKPAFPCLYSFPRARAPFAFEPRPALPPKGCLPPSFVPRSHQVSPPQDV
jgi:hypothetical protein